MENKKPIPVFLLIGIGLSLLVISIFPYLFSPVAADEVEGVSADIKISTTSERKSSFDLKKLIIVSNLLQTKGLSAAADLPIYG